MCGIQGKIQNTKMKQEDFPIFNNNPNLVYLDNAATTQKPQSVIQAIIDFYEKSNANVHRGIHTLSQKATILYEQAHETLAKFINAQPEEIIFTSGTTHAMNTLAHSFAQSSELINLQPGDEIVLTEMEHHSNFVPWQQLALQKKCTLKFIPITKDYELDMQQAEKLITPKTKLVAVTHISNVLGTINPIKELTNLAHKNNALIIVDAAQSAPHIPIDVTQLNCDFLAFSGHKMCGPTGIGVLYAKKEILQKLPPSYTGGGMILEVTKEKTTWADLPEKFEAGTPNIAGAIGLAAAVKYLEQIGMEKIHAHTTELTTYALKLLQPLTKHGLTILSTPNAAHRGAVISFTIDNLHPHDISEELNQQNIAVRAGHHCCGPLMKSLNISGTTRASFYLYNTKEDVDKLIEGIKNVLFDYTATSKDQATTNKEPEQITYDRNEISSQKLTEEQELYKENIIDHYKNPHNFKTLKDYTFKHKEVNPLCGDNITLYVTLENNKVTQVGFQGDGCAISQASISMLTDKIKGMTKEKLHQLTQQDIFDLLGIPISHSRMKCALLSLKALHKGLETTQ